MSGPRAPHPSRRKKREGCKPDNWQTSEQERQWVESWAGLPDLDVAAALRGLGPFGKRWYTSRQNGKRQPWQGLVWCQPPYSTIDEWAAKLVHELYRHDVPPIIVGLFPVRTANRWWHVVEPEATGIYFPKGRLKFYDPVLGTTVSGTPFDSVYMLFDRYARIVEPFRDAVTLRGGQVLKA